MSGSVWIKGLPTLVGYYWLWCGIEGERVGCEYVNDDMLETFENEDGFEDWWHIPEPNVPDVPATIRTYLARLRPSR